jgi:hypothetical protein
MRKPILTRRKKETAAFLELEQELGLTEFETSMLIPTTLANFQFYIEHLEKMLPACDSDDNASLIDGAVKEVCAISLEKTPPNLGKAYLQKIRDHITQSYIPEFSNFYNYYKNTPPTTPKEMLEFAQKAQFLCSPLIRLESRLFSYTFRGFPTIKDKKSGEQMYGLPQEIEIVTFPIKAGMEELALSAKALTESYEHWKQSRQDIINRYIDFVTKQKELKIVAAVNCFQILVIIFTIVLTVLSSEIIDFAHNLTISVTTALK